MIDEPSKENLAGLLLRPQWLRGTNQGVNKKAPRHYNHPGYEMCAFSWTGSGGLLLTICRDISRFIRRPSRRIHLLDGRALEYELGTILPPDQGLGMLLAFQPSRCNLVWEAQSGRDSIAGTDVFLLVELATAWFLPSSPASRYYIMTPGITRSTMEKGSHKVMVQAARLQTYIQYNLHQVQAEARGASRACCMYVRAGGGERAMG